MADTKSLVLLGSTGSIGVQALEVAQGAGYRVAALAAGSGEARTQAASALYAYLAQEAPIAPICFKNGSVLTQWGRLSGLSPVRGNIFNRLEGWIIQ